ncbi:MAG TPA: hypothetical protein VE988_23690 [Gemmataceae bacterium]|nr:hypothetical protein [Gemmataceae bacterium]
MTRKEKVIRMVERLDERDISCERLIYQVTLLKGIEIGQELTGRGDKLDYDNLCQRIEREWEQSDLAPPTIEEIQVALKRDRKASKKPTKHARARSA